MFLEGLTSDFWVISSVKSGAPKYDQVLRLVCYRQDIK